MVVQYCYVAKELTLDKILTDFTVWELHLYQNDYTPDNASETSDFDECDFSGYTAFGITWGTILPDGDGNAASIALVISFQHDGGVTPNDVYGWYLIGAGGSGDVTFYAERFADAPRTMANLGDIINITPQMIQGECP